MKMEFMNGKNIDLKEAICLLLKQLNLSEE
jgi:hypothetical protein